VLVLALPPSGAPLAVLALVGLRVAGGRGLLFLSSTAHRLFRILGRIGRRALSLGILGAFLERGRVFGGRCSRHGTFVGWWGGDRGVCRRRRWGLGRHAVDQGGDVRLGSLQAVDAGPRVRVCDR